MSIFDKFKKIFSKDGESSDFYSKDESKRDELSETIPSEKDDISKKLENAEETKQVLTADWNEFYRKILSDPEIKEEIDMLFDEYKRSENPSDLITNIYYTVDVILNHESLQGIREEKPESLIRNEIASALIKSFEESKDDKTFNVDAFLKDINPDLNDLYTFLTFIYNFIQLYRKNPVPMKEFIQQKDVDVDTFINDAFLITKYYNYFLISPYSNITADKKEEFLAKVNDFVSKYTGNDFLQNLDYCVRMAELQDRLSGAGHPGVIGGNF